MASPVTPYAPATWKRVVLAVLGGPAVWLAFPDSEIGVLAPLGVILLGCALWGAGWRLGLLLGLLAGWAMFVPTLSWSGIFVGRLPWFALATLQAAYVAAMGGVVAGLQTPLLRSGRRAFAALLIPVGWVLQELARGTTPFGGFPWARIAYTQVDSFLVRYAALGGAPLVTFLVAAIAAPVVLLVTSGRLLDLRHAALPALLGLGSLLVPVPTDGQPVRVGLVQGNVPEPGLEFNAERRKVLDNHVVGTQALAAAHPDLDLVVWPENASDIDPLRNVDAATQVGRAVRAADAPLLVGAILDEPSPEVSNASLLYRPGVAEPERYVKQHPVPFAEYVPYRDFFRIFSDKVDLVRVGFAKGGAPVAFEVPTAGGAVAAIPTICFEVAYDGLMRDAVRHAGDMPGLLVVQTNNATFGYSAESTQQFAISRLRAVEHGRPVVHVSTVGVSGFVAADGSYAERTDLFTAEQLAETVRARSGLTVSDRLGPWVEWVSGATLLALVVLGRRSHRAGIVAPHSTVPQTKEDSLRA